MSNEEKALEFLSSHRGQYVMGQALNVAIDSMESVEPSNRIEWSNINDIKFIRDNVFAFGSAMYLASKSFSNLSPDEIGGLFGSSNEQEG